MATGVVQIGHLALESGALLEDVQLSYEMIGPENAPVILICHALTGNHIAIGTPEQPGWWSGLIGMGGYIDTTKFRVITFNVLGGCNDSTGPLSNNPTTGIPYRASFPKITIRDMVHAQKKALLRLTIEHLYAVIGGSLGGMMVLEWGLLYPDDMELLIPIAVTPFYSDYGIAYNYIGIHAIENDPQFQNGNYANSKDVKGFETARMAGMVTYRSDELFTERFGRSVRQDGTFQVESYLRHMGSKITERFDPNSYLTLLRAMNTHDIGEGRGGVTEAVKSYRAKTVSIAFMQDLLYPPEVILHFTHLLPNGQFNLVHTKFGHDGFLTEYHKWGSIIQCHLEVNQCQPLKLSY